MIAAKPHHTKKRLFRQNIDINCFLFFATKIKEREERSFALKLNALKCKTRGDTAAHLYAEQRCLHGGVSALISHRVFPAEVPSVRKSLEAYYASLRRAVLKARVDDAAFEQPASPPHHPLYCGAHSDLREGRSLHAPARSNFLPECFPRWRRRKKKSTAPMTREGAQAVAFSRKAISVTTKRTAFTEGGCAGELAILASHTRCLGLPSYVVTLTLLRWTR